MSTNISNININMNNVKINVKENMIYESNFCKILVERNTLKSYFWHEIDVYTEYSNIDISKSINKIKLFITSNDLKLNNKINMRKIVTLKCQKYKNKNNNKY